MSSVVTSTGLAYYHEKMKTLLANKANVNHTHYYAASDSIGGGAKTANKLTTARTISSNSDSLIAFSTSFDGSGDATGYMNPKCCTAFNGNTNNYPYHRIATYNTDAIFKDASIVLYITGGYQNAPWGIVNIVLRTNSTTNDSNAIVQWLIRSGYSQEAVTAGLYVANGKAYIDVYLKITGTWGGQVIQVLASGDNRSTMKHVFTLIDSTESDNTTTTDAKTSKESYSSVAAAATALYKSTYTKTVTGVDAGIVNYANKSSYVEHTMAVQINGITRASFNGSSDQTVNITPSLIGALPTTGGTLTGAIAVAGGESMFYQGTYKDPANGVACVIKASGNVAATTIYESGSKLSDKYAAISHSHEVMSNADIDALFV